MFSVGLNWFHNDKAVECAEKNNELWVQQFKLKVIRVCPTFSDCIRVGIHNIALAGEKATEGELKIINKFPVIVRTNVINSLSSLDHVIEKSCFISSISWHFSSWLITQCSVSADSNYVTRLANSSSSSRDQF